MEDDDLEYDITFPSPNSSASGPDLNDRREPVVILLGWMGCREKHLHKYSQIYHERGCITIQYTSPRDVVFFKPEKLQDIACKILDLVKDYSIEENPILFHIFSNNGSMMYTDIVKVLTSGDDRYKSLKVCGVIVDSAPGKARLLAAATAYSTSLNANAVVKFFMMFGMLLYLMGNGLITWFISIFNSSHRVNNKFYLFDNMASDPTRWPMLFLYSKTDKLIQYGDVEDVIQRRKQLGVHVDSMCWDDTDHVSHIRKHPLQYEETCEKFLFSCLGDDMADEGMFDTSYEAYLLSKKE